MTDIIKRYSAFGDISSCVISYSLGSKDVFERRMSTGSGSFSFMGSGLAQIFGQIVSMRIKTLNNTYLVASNHIIKEEASLVYSLSVDVCRSKMPLLKLPFIEPFATLETRKKLGRVNFCKDFWDCY